MGRPKKLEGVRKRGSSYEKRFTYKGKQRFVTFKDPDEMEEAVQRKKREIDEGIYCPNRNLTMKQYYDEWITRKEKTVRQSTAIGYKNYFRLYILPHIGTVKLRALERRQIRDMRDDIADAVSAGTANRSIVCLSNMLKSAMEDEIITKNPAEGIKRLKDEERPPARETNHRELTDEEIKTFFSHCGKCCHTDAFTFMLATGVRVGECCGLEWQDIRWPDAQGKGGVVHIRRTVTKDERGKNVMGTKPKTKKSVRDIPMNTVVLEILRKRWELYTQVYGGGVIDVTAPVFPGENGKYTNTVALISAQKRILRLCKKAGEPIKNFGTHAFRDTFASRAIRAGMPPNTLKEILGHASLAMTMDLYAHVNMSDKAQAMEQIIAFPHQEQKKAVEK